MNSIFQKNSPKRVATACRWIAFAFLGAVFLLYLFKNKILLFFPFGLEQIEGEMLFFGKLVSEGKSLYPPLGQTPPFIGCNYPPLYFAVVGFLAKIFTPALVWGRAISFVSALLVGVAIFKISRRAGADTLSAAVGALLFYSLPLVNFFSSLHRIHIFSVCLALWGFYLTIPGEDSLGRISPREFLGMVLMALGTLAKQTAVWAPLACFIWLASRAKKDGRPALFRMLLLAVLTTSGHLFLIATTSGSYYDWVVRYASGIYKIGRLMLYAGWFIKENFVVVAPLVLFFALLSSSRHRFEIFEALSSGQAGRFRRFYHYFFIYLVLVVLSCVLCAKQGSSVAYFTEVCSLLCCLAAVVLGCAAQNSASRLWAGATIAFSFLVLVHIDVNREVITKVYPVDIQFIAARDSAVIRTLFTTEGVVLCEDNIYAFQAQKEPYLVNPFIFTELSKRGIWRPERIKKDIEEGVVTAACLNFPAEDPAAPFRSLLDEELLESVRENLKHRIKIGDRYIYLRKQPVR